MRLWRIANHDSLSGEGGLKYAARWNTAGRRIVYLAETPAGAMIEVLVHLELEDGELPRPYLLLQVEAPQDIAIANLTTPASDIWKTNHSLTRRIGNRWLSEGKTALARVPSAILTNTFNYLLNPLHPDAGRIRIGKRTQAAFDPRLFEHLRG